MTAPTTAQWLRTAVHRIAIGSGRRATYLASWLIHRGHCIWKKTTGWLREGEGLGWLLRAAVLVGIAAVLRKIFTAVAVGVYERAADGGAPWLLWGTALCWLVSAYRAGADGWNPKRPAIPGRQAPGEAGGEQLADQAKDEPAESPTPAAEQNPAGPPPVSPVALVAAVRDIGTPHAQLKPLAEHLRTTTDAVRTAAAGLGWPVKDVRMEGRSSSAGLRWDDCPSPTILAPSSGVVGAGQAADDNDDDTEDSPGEGLREGLRVEAIGLSGLVVHHPAEVVRHHSLPKL